MKVEQTECSETSAFQQQTPVNHLLAYGDETESSETLAFKLQTPVNHPLAYEDGTDRVFRNGGTSTTAARQLPRRNHASICFLIFITSKHTHTHISGDIFA
jgi:hypothetical protein